MKHSLCRGAIRQSSQRAASSLLGDSMCEGLNKAAPRAATPHAQGGLFRQLRRGTQASDKPRCVGKRRAETSLQLSRGLGFVWFTDQAAQPGLPALTCALAQYALFSKYAYLPP